MSKWYSFSFNISWDRNQEPKTWIDIFIIDTIVREVISQKKSEIVFWRMHRRWFVDEHGHELTFDCFTNEEASNEIERLIKDSDAFKVLQKNKLLVEVLERIPGGAEIHGLTDKESWPECLKKSWTYYINGCCEMFLRLIENIKGGESVPTDIQNAEQFYIKVNNELIRIWQSFGCNAFFHHLNAIFGYQPLLIQPRFWADF